jgi:3-hydroxymyristoyl/3-hydroxydecanoyl-(acyl carrier protein) dehydratase
MRLLPDILGERRHAASVELDLHVPAALACFEGHFPGLPILPGVVQIDWAVRFARERLSFSERFSAAQNLKFLSIVRPDARLKLTLSVVQDRLSFDYSDGKQKYSSGTLVFGA